MNQPSKKRRFSFSLRTLMVFMLALCLLFGFIGMRLQRAREQQAILMKIVTSGGQFEFADGSMALPGFWELLVDSHYLDRIESVECEGIPVLIKDNGEVILDRRLEIEALLELKNLRSFRTNNLVTSDLTPLAELKTLEVLDVSNVQVSDLSPLAELKNLERLEVAFTQVSDLTPLAELKNLESLVIHNTQVTDLTPLAKLQKLEWLDLSNTKVSDLTPLAKLKKLHDLDLENTQVSDLTTLAELKGKEKVAGTVLVTRGRITKKRFLTPFPDSPAVCHLTCTFSNPRRQL